MKRVRLYLALVGFTLAGAGVGLDHRGLVWAAIAVLTVAFALRRWAGRRQSGSDPSREPPPRA